MAMSEHLHECGYCGKFWCERPVESRDLLAEAQQRFNSEQDIKTPPPMGEGEDN